MCGRYAQTADMRELMEQFEVSGTAPQKSLPLNWNIAPTNPIYIIRGTSPDLATVSWGLIAPWLKNVQEAKNSQSRAIMHEVNLFLKNQHLEMPFEQLDV